MMRVYMIALLASVMLWSQAASANVEATDSMFQLPNGVETRWASMENPDGRKGEAAQANFGRKGSPARALKAGESFVLAHAENTSGTVRRIWVTINDRSPALMRGIVIRMYWDGADKPAVEAPIGDFFCQPLGQPVKFENAWFSNPEGKSFNIRIPMPFRKSFRITATNESPKDLGAFFYDVNYTIGDKHGSDAGYFHAHFRRENPTTLREDFEILPRVKGRGRFLGCNVGVIADTETYGRTWWGEGEVKMYIDGDREFPTLSGTGTEDYIATGWGQGRYDQLWHGCPFADSENLSYAFYRLHGPDPVYFQKDIRVTIQQIGCYRKEGMIEHMKNSDTKELVMTGDGARIFTVDDVEKHGDYGLFERQDDWCATAYFYLDKPADTLPPIAPYRDRVQGLEK